MRKKPKRPAKSRPVIVPYVSSIILNGVLIGDAEGLVEFWGGGITGRTGSLFGLPGTVPSAQNEIEYDANCPCNSG